MGFEDYVPGIGAGVQTAGGIIGQAMANRANRKLQRDQLNWNENMWHQANEYNTPENQMARMKEAGLHPLLALEGMGGGNAGSPAEGVAPAQMSNTMEGFDPVGKYMEMKNAMQGIENMQTENELTASKVDYQNVLTENAKMAGKQAGIEYDATASDYRESRAQAKITTQTMIMDRMLKEQNLQEGHIRLAYAEAEKLLGLVKTKEEINTLRIKWDLSNQEYRFIEKHKMKIPVNIRSGLITKYILNTVDAKNKGKAVGVLKSVSETMNDAVNRYWKNYDPSKQRKKDWRTKDKEELPDMFYMPKVGQRPGLNY